MSNGASIISVFATLRRSSGSSTLFELGLAYIDFNDTIENFNSSNFEQIKCVGDPLDWEYIPVIQFMYLVCTFTIFTGYAHLYICREY